MSRERVTMTPTQICRHWFQFVALVFMLVFQRVVITATDQTEGSEDKELEESMYTLMDSILEDLNLKYESMKTDEFWHPHDFGTGNDNREVINVVDIMERQITGRFLQWKNARMGLQQQLVGLTSSSIEIYDSNLNQIVTKDMPLTLKTMEVFTKWNTEDLTPFMVIVVATNSPSILMLTSSHEGQLKEIGSFPLSSSVKSVTLCNVESSEKLMLVPENSALPISIYNIESTQDEAQLWFFQRISEPGFDSAIVHQPDTVDSALLVSRGNQLIVYQFDQSLGQFTTKQDLPLEQSCSSMLSFTMMYQNYIGCMAKDLSEQVQFISYNFNMNEYEESVLDKVTASEMFPVTISGSRGDLIFVTRSSNEAVMNTLLYDGQRGFKTGNIGCESVNCAKLSALSNGVSLDFEDSTALALPTAPEHDSATVLVFMTELSSTFSPVFQQSKGLFDEFKVLSKEMNRWRASVSNAKNVLERKLDTDGSNIITGNWAIKTLVAEDVDVDDGRDGRAATSDKVFNMLKFGNVDWTEQDFSSTSTQITSNMATMKTKLNLISNELDDALLKSSPGIQFVRSKVVMEGNLFVENAQVNSINVKSIWGQDITEYFQSLASKESEVVQVKGGLTFSEPLSTLNLETNAVNNVLVEDMALLSGNNVFECPTTFENLYSLRDINVQKVNGINLADSVVMAEDVTNFHFVDGIVAYMGAEVVDGPPFHDVLLSSVPQTVESPIQFDSVQIQGPTTVNNINGKSFTEFTQKIIKNNHQGIVSGAKRFTGSVALTTLFIANQWNGLAFPNEFFSVFNDSLVLNGENSFANVVANKVSVMGLVDGINTGDLVSLTKAENMEKSNWIFNGNAKILRNINVQNTVDGVLMESLIHQGLLHSGSTEFNPNADIVFKQPVHIEDLRIASTINDKTYEELFGNLILFERTDCHIPGTTTITEAATFSDIELQDNKINDFSVENFLTRDTPQNISQTVTFTESVFFEEIRARETFDGVRVQDVLEKALRVVKKTKVDGTTNTTIPWDVHFQSIECKDMLTVEGPVNDLSAYAQSVAVTKGSHSQTIVGPVEFANPIFSTLTTKNVHLGPGRTLQGLDINVWNASRATLSDPATFSQPFSVSRVKIQGNLDTPNINGIDVADLQTTVFRNNGMPQHFSGPMTLMKDLTVHNGDLHFHQAVNGFVLDDIIAHGFPLDAKVDRPIVIKNSWKFESLKINHDVKINGNVCGVDLDALQADSVKRDEKNVKILGEKSFAQGLEITQSLRSPQVNGKSLENAFLLNEDQEVEGHPTFTSNVFKDVLTADAINNVDLAWLKEKYSFEDGQHVLDHDTVINQRLKTDSLRVRGKTRNRDLDRVIADTVKLSDENIEFQDEVEMTSPITVEDAMTTDLYNGVDVDQLSLQVVRLNEDIRLTTPVSFTGMVSAESISVNGDVNALNLGNDVSWNDLTSNSIKLDDPDKQIKFKNMHFDDLVTPRSITTTNLNGHPFENFATLNSEQNLGTLNIAKVILEDSNVNIKGGFNSHDISEEFADTLMNNKEEPQRVSGMTVIDGPIHIKQNISCFSSDLQKDIVTTKDDLELGPLEFTSPVTIENDIQLPGSLEGQSLESIFSGAFMTDIDNSEQVISDKWEFLGPVTFRNDVSGTSVRDKVDLQALVDRKNEDLRRAEKKVDAEREKFIGKCMALNKVASKIAKNPVKFDSFDVHQVISLKNEGTNVLTVESKDRTMLFIQTANCRLDQYEWLPSTGLFHKIVEASPMSIGSVDVWQSAPLKEGGSVIVFSKSITDCSNKQGLFSALVTPNGEISSETPIRENLPIKSFKVVTKPDTGEIRLFNLITSENSGVEVFRWTSDQFEFQEFVELEAPMERVDVTASSRGFGLIGHNQNAVMMYDISNDHSDDVAGIGAILTSRTGTMTVFERFGTLHALLPESGALSPSLIQPTCNFQVMRLNGNSIETVQKLQVPEVASSTMWSFLDKTFLSFLSKSHGLSVYKFMGLNGFQQVGRPYKVFGGFILKSFSVQRPGFDTPQPFMLVLSKNAVEIFRGNVFGDALTSNFPQLCNA